jgi:hypothetical protein
MILYTDGNRTTRLKWENENGRKNTRTISSHFHIYQKRKNNNDRDVCKYEFGQSM